MKPDPFDALARHYESMSQETPPSDLGMSRPKEGAMDRLKDLTPLGLGAAFAFAVVLVASQPGPLPSLPPAPFLKAQMKSAGIAMEDLAPVDERHPRFRAENRSWIV